MASAAVPQFGADQAAQGEDRRQSTTSANAPIPDELRDVEDYSKYRTVFPGWPAAYFDGILPPFANRPMFPTCGFPGYDYKLQPNLTIDNPYPNTVYRAVSPEAMYTTCMPWTAYPYGIPVPLPRAQFIPPPPTQYSPEPSAASQHDEESVESAESAPDTSRRTMQASVLAVPTPRQRRPEKKSLIRTLIKTFSAEKP